MAASARELYHPMSRKDIMPTPSQPVNRRVRFPAEIRRIMASRKIRRWAENIRILGSVCMYQVEK